MRAVGHDRKGHKRGTPRAALVLAHDERVLRRRRLTLPGGGDVLVDLPEPVVFDDGDVLVLDDGGTIAIMAAEEDLLEVIARDPAHLAALVWHIGNRHLACEIGEGAKTVRIARSPVIGAMLEGLGAELVPVRAPFAPLRGAYDGGHGHAPAGPGADRGPGARANG